MQFKPSLLAVCTGSLIAGLSTIAIAQQPPMENLQSSAPNNWEVGGR